MALFSWSGGTKKDKQAKGALSSWTQGSGAWWRQGTGQTKASGKPRDSWASPGNLPAYVKSANQANSDALAYLAKINSAPRKSSNPAPRSYTSPATLKKLAEWQAKQQLAYQQQMQEQYERLQAQLRAQEAERRRQQMIQQKLNELNSGLASLGLPPVAKYPTKPLPIPALKLKEWAEKRAAAARAVKEARSHQKLESGNVKDRFSLFQGDLERQVERDRETAWDEAVSRNLALSPIFINPALKDIREEESAALAAATQEKTHALAALQRLVDQASTRHKEVVAETDRDKAYVRSELDKLVRL